MAKALMTRAPAHKGRVIKPKGPGLRVGYCYRLDWYSDGVPAIFLRVIKEGNEEPQANFIQPHLVLNDKDPAHMIDLDHVVNLSVPHSALRVIGDKVDLVADAVVISRYTFKGRESEMKIHARFFQALKRSNL